jgi:hypothetical protein
MTVLAALLLGWALACHFRRLRLLWCRLVGCNADVCTRCGYGIYDYGYRNPNESPAAWAHRLADRFRKWRRRRECETCHGRIPAERKGSPWCSVRCEDEVSF